ncbi:endoglucanase-like [Euwallacea fornicatus]|uniref:endoglucanase-like n=1 Tax=Euwallacea fornicatus TaxID=995702 RepID=UPI00338D54BF
MKTQVFAFVFCIALGMTNAALSGTGSTTRYWDCCKPSCSWSANVNGINPVRSCAADGTSVVDASATSGCDGGNSYVCNSLQPWAVNDSLAYGFVAGSFSGGVDTSKCGICLKMTFTTTSIAGKTMIVQTVNTGSDLGQNHFDIQIPGGGVGIFTRGCSSQWNAPSSGWGAQYGGVSSDSECNNLPSQLQSGCHFRFGWFQNADNPQVNFVEIPCPSALTSLTGTA